MNQTMTWRWLTLMLVGFIALLLLSLLSNTFGRVEADRQIIALEVAASVSGSITETFESGLTLPTDWSTVDNDANGAEHVWAPITAPVSIGNGPSVTMTGVSTDDKIVWAIGGGAAGSVLDADPTSTDTYSPSTKSALFFGPIDLTGVVTASVSFDYWFDGSGSDVLSVGIVTGTKNADNLSANSPQTFMNGTSNWQTDSITVTGNQTDVYVVFYFEGRSSGGNPNQKGVFIDNVFLSFAEPGLIYMPVLALDPTPTPTFTPTPQLGTFRDDFTGDVNGWEDRERNLFVSTDNRISNAENTYLQVDVAKENQFVIVSPLEAGPDRNYTIETRARFVTPDASDEFGIVFAADWDTAQACPDGDAKFTTCFNQYYVVRFIYRDGGGAGDAIEYRIEKVTSHSEAALNAPQMTTLRAERIDPNIANPVDWNTFQVRYETDDDIKFFINGIELGSANRPQDGDYANQKYFGVWVMTETGNSYAAAQFDYFDIRGD